MLQMMLDYLRIRYRAGMNEEQIAAYQKREARRLARYAVDRAPFYRRLYHGYDLDDVWRLPPTDKEMVMDNLTEANTVGLTRKEIIDFCLENEETQEFSSRLNGYAVGMSSGTSGNKGVEIASRREENLLRAYLFAVFPRPSGKLNLAFILRVSSPAFNIDRFGHRLTYISQLNALETIRDRLEKLQPNAISAPPSMLRVLADEHQAGRLHVSPEMLISYAEVLSPDVERYLTEVFDCPVYEIYKATEGAIAASRPCGNLHLNEDLVAVELYDERGEPTPPGEPCHTMLVTNLVKRALPFIRYELNDVVTIREEPCHCGSAFRVIESVQGRADDMFWASRTSGGSQFIFPDYIRRGIISSSDAIEDYRAVQEHPGRVSVYLRLAPYADEDAVTRAVVGRLEDVFREYGCEVPSIVVRKGLPTRDRGDKLIRVRREFDAGEL